MIDKKLWLFFAGVAVVLLAVAGGVALVRQLAENNQEQAAQSAITSNFGITYVPVRGKQAESLGVSSGALVTEVAAGSPCDHAGIQVNDVILTFNGVTVENGAPLYGLMTSCPMGNVVQMEIWHQQMVKSVTLVNTAW